MTRRLGYMAITLLLVSIASFVIVQAAPGDYAEIYAAKKAATGSIISQAEIERVRVQLGLDQPLYIQYLRWLNNAVLRFDFGDSWEWKRPVADVIGERMPLTLTIAFATLFFMYVVAVPIGIYSPSTAIRSATTPSRSSAISASPFPISCWRWCCST